MTAGITWLDVATALDCPGNTDQDRVRAAQGRMNALGYTRACSRCGGSGNYSYCAMYGTRCFGCSGSGKQFVKLTKKVVDEAVFRQAAGELEPYFERCRARAAAKRALVPVLKTITAEWENGPVHTSYKALRGTDSALVVESAEFRAAGLVNDIWGAAQDVVSCTNKDGTEARLARANELLEMLREVQAAWAAYDGEGRITPPPVTSPE